MAKHTARGGVLDSRSGLDLFRDPRVPVSAKVAAVVLGIAITLLLQVIEAPIELLLVVLLPGFGLGLDLLLNGLEILMLPIVISCLILPRLVRQPAYARARIIDMPPPMLD
ncbi:MAG: hypothetical protein QOJ65_336 [Fimbriimonadaceae bacterium]|nr:hypothetical protein [Fimbriimonadaceae bacterium]